MYEARTVTRAEILDYAKECGNETAYNVLLLGGPDLFDGDFCEYERLLDELENSK